MTQFEVERYCLCGAALKLKSSDCDAVRLGDESFSELHQGEGHGPTSKREAREARRRNHERLLRDADE